MTWPRLLLPLFLAFSLLSAQQGEAAHALGHILGHVGHQGKHAPHSPVCEQCAAYAQIGSALHVNAFSVALATPPSGAVLHRSTFFRSVHPITPAARGPPSVSQKLV